MKSESEWWRNLPIYVLGGGLCVVVLFGIFVGMVPFTWTTYAGGYSERRFNRIKTGEPESAVRAALGTGLRETVREDDKGTVYKCLEYSAPNVALYHRYRGITIS